MTARRTGTWATGRAGELSVIVATARKSVSLLRGIGDTEKENNVYALALKMTKDEKMVPEFDTGEFLSLSRAQRIAKCRDMAAESERLAVGKGGDMRAAYLDLAAQWSDLADEMESLSKG